MKAIKQHVRKTFKMGASHQDKAVESDGKTNSSLSQSDLSLNAEDFSFTSNSPRTVDTASTSDSMKLDSLSNGSATRYSFKPTSPAGDNQKLVPVVTAIQQHQKLVSTSSSQNHIPSQHQKLVSTVSANLDQIISPSVVLSKDTNPAVLKPESIQTNHNGNNNYAPNVNSVTKHGEVHKPSPSDKIVNVHRTSHSDKSEDMNRTSTSDKHEDVHRPSPFDKLTDDVVVHIFSKLSTKQLCRCSCVSRRWQQLVWQPLLWRTIQLSARRTNIDHVLTVILRRLAQETPYVCLSVERVILNNCQQLTGRGVELIANHCPELRHLELVGCHQVTDTALFQILTRCINLDYLDISGCKRIKSMHLPVDQRSPDPEALVKQQVMSESPLQVKLRHLDMSDCPLLNDDALRTIASNCPTLVNLFLRRCERLTDIGVQYVTTQCLMLKEVSLSDCPFITDSALWQLAKLEYHLRYLSVAKCEQITDQGIQAIATMCYKLRYLNIRGCIYVSDKSLEMLSQSCSRLRSLDVGKCPLITDRGLIAIATNCPSLRKLSVKGCLHVTDSVIEVLAQVCPDLQQLNIQDCEEVTRGAYKLLKRCCRKCIIEHTNPAFY